MFWVLGPTVVFAADILDGLESLRGWSRPPIIPIAHSLIEANFLDGIAI
jgi:hypothetical protein